MKLNELPSVVVGIIFWCILLYYSHQATQSIATTTALGVIVLSNYVLFFILRYISKQTEHIQRLLRNLEEHSVVLFK